MAKIADRHFLVHPWEVREQGFDPAYAQVSESIFSLGNEYMGVRGYFEEGYSGASLQGSYINGVYERRTLAKSGYRGMLHYTEFMVNTVDVLYTRIRCNGVLLDLAACEIEAFERALDLKTGVLTRRFVWRVGEDTSLLLTFERFLSMEQPDTAGQRISFHALSGAAALTVEAGLDFSRQHQSSGENYWEITGKKEGAVCAITGSTRNTKQVLHVIASFSGMPPLDQPQQEADKIASQSFAVCLRAGEDCTLTRIARMLCAKEEAQKAGFGVFCREAEEGITAFSYDALKEEHLLWWARQWEVSDIKIDGDDESQQGIRYCIFQLHQTLHTADHSSIIGAKGLTGESYNGNTFWDTEVFCLPFYLYNNPSAAKNILQFRYDTLPQAKERARALDCSGAFYPVATISGTECCDLWQHASLQLQASTGVMYGLWCYVSLTGDRAFLYEKGAEMLVEISRMLASRGDWSGGEYGFYGVMGPDEFQMMVHNNTYTNFMAQKTFLYTLEVLEEMRRTVPEAYRALAKKTALTVLEQEEWRSMSQHMRILYTEETKLFEQHDGFFRLPHVDVNAIPVEDFPLYSHWSYERIYRNDMLKQPDVLMFLLLYRHAFSKEQLAANYAYYEPRCIHESSLSPSVHSILAAEIGRMEQAYAMFRFAARLDLDNYNRNTDEGLHITSIAGSWLNVVYGFGGLMYDGERLRLSPTIPVAWEGYAFSLPYRGAAIKVSVTKQQAAFCSDAPVEIEIYGRKHLVDRRGVTIPLLGEWEDGNAVYAKNQQLRA